MPLKAAVERAVKECIEEDILADFLRKNRAEVIAMSIFEYNQKEEEELLRREEYEAGIFIMGAGIGLTLTVYIIHPTTSFSFFICLLAGVGLGMLALRYEREVIIVGTSILGGILSGFATAKLANMEEIPFGIIFSVGFSLVGMLIQFAINKPKYEDDYDEEEEEVLRGKRRKREADGEENFIHE